MLNYEHLKERFIPQFLPPRKFVEYSDSPSNETEAGRSQNPIFIGLDSVSKRSKSKKKIAILNISQFISPEENEEIVDPVDRKFSETDFFFQKDLMSYEKIFNIFSEGIDNILDLQQAFLFSNNFQTIRDFAIQLATQAKNSSSRSSLLPINTDKQNSCIKLIYDSYYMISKKLKLYTINSFLKNDLSYLESVNEIGQLYKICQGKVNLISSCFSSLCLSKFHLSLDFDEIFEQTIEEVFSGKKTINNCVHYKFDESSNDNTETISASTNFSPNDSYGFDIISNPFGGFGSPCNSNDFNAAFNEFQGNDSEQKQDKEEGKEEEEKSEADEIFEVEFDGQELFEKVSLLIIHYFIENVIWKKSASSSPFFQDAENKESEADLTSFYYNINNKEKEGNENSHENLDDLDPIENDRDFISAFQFMKKTGNLYESRFIPTLIDAIISEYNPIVAQFFEKCEIGGENSPTMKNLTLYFNDIRQTEIELDMKLKRASILLSNHSIEQIQIAFRHLAFASKLDEICKSGLSLLVQKKDIKTIELCAVYAKSTNIIQNFAHELSFDLESVVSDNFKGVIESENDESNPIREAIDYLNMLNKLCTSSFSNEDMKKTLQNAFRKGLNVLPDQAARLLAEEVNYRFLNLPSYTSKLINEAKTTNKKVQEEADENEETKDKESEENEETKSNENEDGIEDGEIDKSLVFSHLPFIEDLINIFKYLTCKDVFEAYYHLYLSRRVFMLKASVIQADEFFASLLRETCGSEYTKRIDTIFHDLHHSSRALSDFQEEETRLEKHPPCYFKALVLNQSSWITNIGEIHQTPIETPACVRGVLSDFAQFYLSKNPNKQLEWNHHFSRVKLSVRNPSSPSSSGIIKEIQCNGIAATILCLFNDHKTLTKKEMIDLCKGSEKIIDECIKVLKSKKTGKILKSLKSPTKSGYTVDLESTFATDAANSAGIIKLPFIKMILPKSETDNAIMHIESSRAHVIDANIMLFLKREHSIDKQFLKERIKEIIPFRLDDELFETELVNLKKKLYLKMDSSGRVHYLP